MLFISKQNLSKGLSLIEASMVLALSAVVVSGVLYYYNNAASNRKLEEDSKTIQMVISTIRTLYENQRPTVSIDADAVAKAGNFTTKKNSTGKTIIVMPTGETLNIINGTSSGTRMYAIDFFTSDKNICAHLASARYGTSHFATEVVEDSGNVSLVKDLLAKSADERYLSVDEAASDCSSKIDSASGGTVRVYMAFKG